MIDERLEAQAGLYVLGALPLEEIHEFETALRADLQLQQLVNHLRAASNAIVFAFPRVEPPPALRARVLAAIPVPAEAGAIITPPGWLAWVPWALAACFAVLCVVLLALGNSIRQQSIAVQDRLETAQQRLAELEAQSGALTTGLNVPGSNLVQQVLLMQTQLVQRAEDLKRQKQNYEQQLQQAAKDNENQKAVYVRQLQQALTDRDTLKEKLDQVSLGNQDRFGQMRVAALNATADYRPAVAASLWDATEQRGVLQVEKLPPLPPTLDYQLWLFDPQYPAPISAGAFNVDANGSARLQFSAAARIAQAQRFAITVERKGGVAAPTGRIAMDSNAP